jgi:small-conductance mechanosensitive channel
MTYSALLDASRETLEKVREHFPAVAGAVLLLLLGWGIAWILSRVFRGLTERLLARLEGGPAIGEIIESSDARVVAPRLVRGFVFWLVMLLFAAAAVEVLGLPIMTDLLGRVVAYLPNLLAAVVIAFGGFVAARIARAAVAKAAVAADITHAGTLANAVNALILLMALVIALEQLGVNGRVLELTLAVAVGSSLAAAALAFGLGARASVANIVAARYVAQLYRIGQEVRIDGLEGTVVQLTPTAVVVQTAEGRAVVPAARFQEASSVLLSEGS